MSTLSRMGRAFAITMMAALPFRAQDDGMAERLFRSGQRAYGARAYQEALETWNQLLQVAPHSPFAAQALLCMARHWADVEKKPDAALPLLERIKIQHLKSPEAPEALLLRGEILARLSRKPQDLKEAMGEFNRVVDLFPDHPAVPAAEYSLGMAFRAQGQLGRALQSFAEALHTDPASPVAPRAQFQLAETLDLMGDLPGCLRTLQEICNRYPESPEAKEAAWRIDVRIRHRVQRLPLVSEGPWPEGRQKWLKTPTLLAQGVEGELFVYQDDLDRAFRLKGTELFPVGPQAKSIHAMAIAPDGRPWLISAKQGVLREGEDALPLGSVVSPSGALFDPWGNLWISDAKGPNLTILEPGGTLRSIPSPAAVAMAPLPTGGAVTASDLNRCLLFLDSSGQPLFTVPFGKDLPGPFKHVLALCSDPLGHVAALVDGGDFEGVVLWGPDGALLRWATFKGLGISGRFRAIALDRQGGILLADRSHDLLLRLH